MRVKVRIDVFGAHRGMDMIRVLANHPDAPLITKHKGDARHRPQTAGSTKSGCTVSAYAHMVGKKVVCTT